MKLLILLSCCLLIIPKPINTQDASHREIKHSEIPELVRNWAGKLGGELWHFGEFVTRRNMVVEKFKYTQIVQEDSMALFKDIKEKIQKMMEEKVKAVQRIMEVAENVAATATEIVDDSYQYYSAKDLINPLAEDQALQDDGNNGSNIIDEERDDMTEAEAVHSSFKKNAPETMMMIDSNYQEDEAPKAVPPPQPETNEDTDDLIVEEEEEVVVEEEEEAEVEIVPPLETPSVPSPTVLQVPALQPPTIDENDDFVQRKKAAEEVIKPVDNLEEVGTRHSILDAIENVESGTGSDGTEEEEQEQSLAASHKPQAAMEDKTRMPLYENINFYNIPVNLNHSAVHVPSNVYDRSKEVIKGIKWSEELDGTFRHNYKMDPTLSWQYFGSSTGFMRQFPAMKWYQEPVDMFDCRTRNWFIEAASSPKDVVVLIDRSGSMTGMRREIAKHVATNILDTLGNNDYVNVYTFSNTTEPLIDCYEDMLVQANLANVRLFKEALPSFRTEQIANFSLALTTAFKLLQDYRENRPGQGAQCNQAIMLITDGVYYNFKEIFKEYNWQNLPFMPVRVFTYLIGREVSDVREVKWMACANQGYYVHLSTYAEVREEVLQYIPVMARPMVLNPTLKPRPTWSPVYADVADPKLTNWLWTKRERNKQRDRFLLYKRNRTLFFMDDALDKKFVYQQQKKLEESGELQSYRLMTSVSLPVYDRRPNANISEKIQINEKIWITVVRETKIANLLGVAGTDVPIEYIQRLMSPYRLGVNSYAFIVTNNGYILIHPDLRPVFQGILKPAYNRVDMIEIELIDDDTLPREFSDKLKDFRKAVVNQSTGQISFRIKTHLDEMNRLFIADRRYIYGGVDGTPFSLVLSLMERYGDLHPLPAVDDDVHRMRTNNVNITQFFQGGNWTLHPDWHYCRHVNADFTYGNSAGGSGSSGTNHNGDPISNNGTPFNGNRDEEFMQFLRRMDSKDRKWKWTRECDRKLVCLLVADAKKTAWFNQNISTSNKEENSGHEFIKRFGITVAFLATYSGLTRWQQFPQNTALTDRKPPFYRLHNRAVDEVWYRRAVEQHYSQPHSFVYSVPFDAEFLQEVEFAGSDDDDVLVTASHAIFAGGANKTRKAPVAVVGFQFYHSALRTLFMKITNSCAEIKSCKRTCSSGELYCLVLDDSGFVLVSYDGKHTGAFLGDFRPDILELLVEERVYTRSVMYDYQATCFPVIQGGMASSGSRSWSFRWAYGLWRGLLGLLMNLVTVTARLMRGTERHRADVVMMMMMESSNSGDSAAMSAEDQNEDLPPSRAVEKEFDQRLLINKTQPEPCDTLRFLYRMSPHIAAQTGEQGGQKKTNTSTESGSAASSGSWRYFAQPIGSSNLLLLVINMVQPAADIADEFPSPTKPVEVLYGNITRQCHIEMYNNFPRRNYMSCINRSIHEKDIELCGGGVSHLQNGVWLITFMSITILIVGCEDF